VHVLVRGDGLAASMSRYLVDRIEATPSVELHSHTEVVALHGDDDARVAGFTCRDRRSGAEQRHAVRNVFLFIGADPETNWVRGCDVELDKHGFVVTGAALAGDDGRRAQLESSIAGVFAVGDVRSGSVKRVGGAIGEGAAAVAQIHQYLSDRRSAASSAARAQNS
jgi:thioredoxin reductase (NADPH)